MTPKQIAENLRASAAALNKTIDVMEKYLEALKAEGFEVLENRLLVDRKRWSLHKIYIAEIRKYHEEKI